EGQLTFAHAVGTVTGCAAWHVPSAWQTPSPQSASRSHLPVPPAATLQSSLWGSHACDAAFLSTHAASRPTKTTIASFPDPIPHLPQAQRQGGAHAAGRQPAGRPSGNTPGFRPFMTKRSETFLTTSDRASRSRGPFLTRGSSNDE